MSSLIQLIIAFCFAENKITSTGVKYLLDAITSTPIRRALGLGGVYIAIPYFSRYPRSQALAGNFIDTDGVTALADTLRSHQQLTGLSLAGMFN